MAILTREEWRDVDLAVDRGLAWLIRQQQPNGAFGTIMQNEPGITGLCLMAFLSRGHLPGEGEYGAGLTRAVDFILKSQQPDGLISRERDAFRGAYNHAIGALVVAEAYGMAHSTDEKRHRAVIERAIVFTSQRYWHPKSMPADEGGWRYLRRHGASDSDLSLTSFNVMFLRSARNAGFEFDDKLIEDALGYMERTYDPGRKTFRYKIHDPDPTFNHPRAMAGAGVLSLAMAGKHDSEMARNASNAILRQPFDQYVRPVRGEQLPCFSAFYCSQAMFQMGGDYWSQFYPTMSRTIIEAQRDEGSWIMRDGDDILYGVPYMTAMTILALTPPYQMLPVLQR